MSNSEERNLWSEVQKKVSEGALVSRGMGFIGFAIGILAYIESKIGLEALLIIGGIAALLIALSFIIRKLQK